MRLGEWLKQNEKTPAQLAEEMGVKRSTVSRWVKGQMPNVPAVLRIIEITGGKVTANDFLPEAEAQPTVKPEDERPAAA